MSERGKVHPGCVNASNPYHQCVEECYRKIAGGKPHKSKNQSGNVFFFIFLGFIGFPR